MSKNFKDVSGKLLSYLQGNIEKFCIDENKREALCFKERLDVYSKNKVMNVEPIGSYQISVESIGPKNREFLVHVVSSMIIDGSVGGSKVTSSATDELHCLEEKRNEFVQAKNGIREKNFYLSSGDDAYFVQITHKTPYDVDTNSFHISYSDDYKLISDGCNILLVRYLAITDFNGLLSLNIITMDGKVAICEYECFQAKAMKINGLNLDLCCYEIKQRFYENNDVVRESKTLLTKQGKILSLDWIDTPYMMQINPLLDPLTCNKKPIIIPLQAIWKEDIQMLSKYLDKKTYEEAKQEDYLSLHSEIYYLITDYVQTLLCRKPDDVLTFSVKYFKTFIETENSIESLNPKEVNFDDEILMFKELSNSNYSGNNHDPQSSTSSNYSHEASAESRNFESSTCSSCKCSSNSSCCTTETSSCTVS